MKYKRRFKWKHAEISFDYRESHGVWSYWYAAWDRKTDQEADTPCVVERYKGGWYIAPDWWIEPGNVVQPPMLGPFARATDAIVAYETLVELDQLPQFKEVECSST